MENDNRNKLLKQLFKFLTAAERCNGYDVNGVKVRLVFSVEKDAPTIEELLVKIASGS